jgi:uncharacterized membrane protein
MVLFELIALIFLTIGAIIITDNEAFSMGGLAILLSFIAMFWNYGYNVAFDKAVPGNRLDRSKNIRLLHGVGFESGMIVISFPVIMWFLKLDFFSVFMMDIGLVAFFFIYAIVFNWLYDISRYSFVNSNKEP